jgi:hypothetical protein
VAFNGWVFTKKDVISKMRYIDVEKYDPDNIKVRLQVETQHLLLTISSEGEHDRP